MVSENYWKGIDIAQGIYLASYLVSNLVVSFMFVNHPPIVLSYAIFAFPFMMVAKDFIQKKVGRKATIQLILRISVPVLAMLVFITVIAFIAGSKEVIASVTGTTIIYAISILVAGISEVVDSFVYSFIENITRNKTRGVAGANVSNLFNAFIDTFLFAMFLKIYIGLTLSQAMGFWFASYIAKIIIAGLCSPIIYRTKKVDNDNIF